MKDAIFNAQRMAMFVDAVHTKDSAMMKLALHDRLHQPYRMKLMPGLEKIMEQLKYEENVLGCVISGAGSTILLITENNGAEKAKSIVKNVWHDLNVKVDMYDFPIDTNGAQIIN